MIAAADTESFHGMRPRLIGIAHRIVGSAAEADDVVQDAWIRWQNTDRSEVRDAAAFLATTTARLAINVRQSARARRESSVEPWLAERVDTRADPARRAEQREALEQAMRVLLERLSPTERAAYVLREAFDYPYRRISQVLSLSEPNARQLVTRARLHLGSERRLPVDASEQRRLLEAFVAAARNGQLGMLERRLAAARHGRDLAAAA